MRDEQRPHTNFAKLLAEDLSRELWPIVRADVKRCAEREKKVGQGIQ